MDRAVPVLLREGWVTSTAPLDLSAPRAFKVAQNLVHCLHPFSRCLLWITAWDIFSRDSDHYLFYQLRKQASGEVRHLGEAPGHLLLGFETNEFESLVFLGITAGWDMYAITWDSYANWHVSHDEFIEIAFATEEQRSEFEAWAKPPSQPQ